MEPHKRPAPPDIACSASTQSSNEDGGLAKSSKSPCQNLEAENELRQFLKVVRPDWSCPLRGGHNNLYRVIEKLKEVGVFDTAELIRRVNENTINEDLSSAGHIRFGRETLEKMRKESSFMRALEHTKDPYYRQVGGFAPARQLCSEKNLRHGDGVKKANICEDDNHGDGSSQKNSQSHGLAAMHGELGRPATVAPAIAVGLGDRGGVFVSGTSCVTTSDNFADLFAGMPNSMPGALYLRNARPRHGRLKPSQSRPVTVSSLPDLTKLQRSNVSGRQSTAGFASRSYSPLRGRVDSGSSTATSWCDNGGSDWDPTDKWSRTGTQITRKPWVAKWTKTGKNLVVRQGEAMLREQTALDDQRALYKVIEREGDDSPMRTHLTSRIRSRLREEKERDQQGIADMQQRCMNIKNNICKMQATRRELVEHKRKAEDALQLGKEAGPQGDSKAAFSEMFRKAVAKAHIDDPLS